jgi:hypothetical protein
MFNFKKVYLFSLKIVHNKNAKNRKALYVGCIVHQNKKYKKKIPSHSKIQESKKPRFTSIDALLYGS